MDGAVVAAGMPAWRRRIGEWVEGPLAQRIIAILIVLNAVTLGLETSPSVMDEVGPWLLAFDHAVLAVFVVEILAKLQYRGWSFFRNGWNVFDFIIVGIALMPASGELAVMRALRVLRVLRLISVVPQMRRVVSALLSALPGMASVGGIIALIFYVGAVIATKLYAETFPEWFGTIGASMYTLFQVMTLESWSMGIVRPVMEQHPGAWAFFVPFIVTTSFAILNLFIGIIVDAMNVVQQEEEKLLNPPPEIDPTLAELRALREDVAALRRLLAERPAAG